MSEIERAAELLRQGRLVAFPTETVYGLGADATNPLAIERIYQTKGRPNTNPLIVHVASAEIARRYAADWPLAALRLAERFWPGPLTIVLPKNPIIPDNATAGLGTVGLRVPNHPLALELLRAVDRPLAAPSANRSTRVSPTTARHVGEEFPQSEAAGGAAGNEPAMILDGGACEVGIESTVLDLSGETPTILRPGGIMAGELKAVIGPVVTRSASVDAVTAATSPGQQNVHYAPHTPTYRFERGQMTMIKGSGIGVILLGSPRTAKGWEMVAAMSNDPIEYAKLLYTTLRWFDSEGLRAIYVEMPPDELGWAAVRDRLMRATRPIETA